MSYVIFLYFLGFVVWMVDTYLHKRMQKDCYHLVKECSLQQSIGNRSWSAPRGFLFDNIQLGCLTRCPLLDTVIRLVEFHGFVVWMVDTYLHKRMQKDCYHLVKECSLQQSIGNRSWSAPRGFLFDNIQLGCLTRCPLLDTVIRLVEFHVFKQDLLPQF